VIDPITAFATAQAAIKGIQAAIKMGKDIHAMSGDIMKLFDARNEVAVAAVREKQNQTSALTQASNTVLNAHALAESVRELKEHFIYNVKGGGDLWEAIVAEHNAIVLQRRKELREAEEAKKLKRENLAETLNILFCGFAGCIAGGLICWGTFEFIIYKMRL
jgi:hypothetical protein